MVNEADKDTNEEVVENEQKTTEDKNKEGINYSDTKNPILGPLILLTIVVIIVIFIKLVIPTLKPSRFGATSILNQSAEEVYLEDLFK